MDVNGGDEWWMEYNENGNLTYYKNSNGYEWGVSIKN